MTGQPNPRAVRAGAVIASVIPLGLMLWAASETTGPLRWALLAWVVFVVLIYLWKGQTP